MIYKCFPWFRPFYILYLNCQIFQSSIFFTFVIFFPPTDLLRLFLQQEKTRFDLPPTSCSFPGFRISFARLKKMPLGQINAFAAVRRFICSCGKVYAALRLPLTAPLQWAAVFCSQFWLPQLCTNTSRNTFFFFFSTATKLILWKVLGRSVFVESCC